VTRLLNALSSIAVLLAVLFPVTIFFTKTSHADPSYCLGPNLCAVWHTPHNATVETVYQQCAEI